jgi:hypothetical protein
MTLRQGEGMIIASAHVTADTPIISQAEYLASRPSAIRRAALAGHPRTLGSRIEPDRERWPDKHVMTSRPSVMCRARFCRHRAAQSWRHWQTCGG